MKAKRDKAKRHASAVEPVASATECTGLMPALARDDAQEDAEAALCGIHSARGARGSLPDE